MESMASNSKRSRAEFDEPDETTSVVFDEDLAVGGMSSGEESELDWELENLSEESRYIRIILLLI